MGSEVVRENLTLSLFVLACVLSITVKIWSQVDFIRGISVVLYIVYFRKSPKHFLILCASDASDKTRRDCKKPRETAVKSSGARLELQRFY